MINKINFTKNYVEDKIKKYPKVDITKIEMTLFAFELLDKLVHCGIPLIFKGGTSLLLLLDDAKRLSTDIDIIVPKKFDFDNVFDKIKKEFPFYDGEERGKSKNNHFRHFYFSFKGPLSKKDCRINLDIAFENNPYPKIIKKEISHTLILTSGIKTFVNIPSHESILGDKLTAFAPTTIGVNPFMTSLGKKIDNRLQVIKQFYDIARLYNHIDKINDVLLSYKNCHKFENIIRDKKYSIKETLLDSFNHAALIASMGLWDKKSKFYEEVVKPGILGINSNIIGGRYNQVDAANDATKVMYLTACLLANCSLNNNISEYKGEKLKLFKSITDKKGFILIRKSLSLLNNLKLL